MSRICIGLPVYNGERYIAEAVNSILSQTYTDFELIIVDNASTDGTQKICEGYSSMDARVRYCRNLSNIGAAQNFNKAFRLSNSEYFKWAAHDDVLAPEYLEHCIGVLDQREDVVACNTLVNVIDDRSNFLEHYKSHLTRLQSNLPVERYKDCILKENWCYDVFGVIRSSSLATTPCIAEYWAADLVLLAELTLVGKIFVVPKALFLSRDHANRSVCIPVHQRAREWWSHPDKPRSIVFPYWRILSEHIKTVRRSALERKDRRDCYAVIFRWVIRNWRYLRGDIRIFAQQIFGGVRKFV